MQLAYSAARNRTIEQLCPVTGEGSQEVSEVHDGNDFKNVRFEPRVKKSEGVMNGESRPNWARTHSEDEKDDFTHA